MRQLLSRLPIGPRIITGFAIVLIMTTAIIVPVTIQQLNGLILQAEKRELETLFDNIEARIKAEGRLAQGLSSTMATLPYLRQLFAEGRRDELHENLAATYKYLRADFNVRQFQFHTPPATSFLRVHKPQKFGDDLSSFRNTVVQVNKSQTGIWGIEKGVAGLGIRGVMPVIHNEEHIGSVEFGMSFGQPFFDAVKAEYGERGMELALHIKATDGYKAFAKTFEEDSILTTSLFDHSMTTDAPVLEHSKLNGVHKVVYVAPVKDYSGTSFGVMEIAINRDEYMRTESNIISTIVSVGIIALIIGMIMAYVISRSIAKPLCTAKLAMDDIAEGDGDLTHRLPVNGNDEVAQLADAFNRFATKVQNMVSTVAGSTSQLSSAAEEMSSVTSRSDELIQEQKRETDQIVTAINEMAVTIREVARSAELAAASAIEADDKSREGQQIVLATSQAITSLATEVGNAAEAIHKLQEDSQSIGTVLDVIRDVAEQTNLLALNAAIEAARAGEHGRGFAVVADEVRTLASRTQESTQEISSIIERFRRSSEEAVKAMQEGRAKADNSVAQAQEAGKALEAIAASVATINDMNQQIASASEEQSAVAEEVNRNIVSMNNMTEEVSSGSEQTAKSSQELASLAGELQTQVNQFKY